MKLLDDEITADFDSVLTTAIRISQGTAGIPTSRVTEMASQLLMQNVITSLTIDALVHPPPRLGISELPQSFTVTDLPSLCILTRGIVETYLTLFYIAVESVPAAEREFRLLWWDWHEVNERICALNWIGSKTKNLEPYGKKRNALRSRIAKHTNYSSLPKKLKNQFEQQKLPTDAVLLSKAQIAEIAGVHPVQFRVVYKSLSQYAHAQPIAISTMLGSSASSPEVKSHFNYAVRHAISYLLFSVRDFITVFPEGRELTDEKFWRLVAIWGEGHNADLGKTLL